MSTAVKKSDGDRLIAPGSVLLKFVDGHWSAEGESLAIGTKLFVIGLARGLRCFMSDGTYHEIKERPGEPLPDPEVLNAEIPKEQWGTDFEGDPRAPWKLTHIFYLVEEETAGSFTFLNSTWGCQTAWERLERQIHNRHRMFDGNWAPFVVLDSRPMPTRRGQKLRPALPVVEWRDIGGAPALLLPAPV